MAEEEVKLLGVWGSAFSRRVEIALQIKGIKYEYIEEDLSNKSPLLLKSNPIHKKIPVLVHNGNPIAESLVILEYIDETWKNTAPILPKDPYERALARFWAKFLDEKCLFPLRDACSKKGEEQEKAIAELREALQILENELKDKKNKFFGGDNLGFVDIVGNFLALWLGVLQEVLEIEFFTKEKHPNLCQWMEEYLSCSIISENMPDRDKLLAYFKGRFGSHS